jgi:hypothetical protein
MPQRRRGEHGGAQAQGGQTGAGLAPILREVEDGDQDEDQERDAGVRTPEAGHPGRQADVEGEDRQDATGRKRVLPLEQLDIERAVRQP